MSSDKRRNLAKRIARIHGHVHGIMQMLEQGRSYSEIVHQISAVKAGLDSAVHLIVQDLVEDYLANAGKKKSATEAALELRKVIARIR